MTSFIQTEQTEHVINGLFSSISNFAVGTFAISWVMTKFTEPLRLGVTVAIVPTVARFLGKAPPKESVPK